jgi:DNA-binding transcriptional LysR family regulator
MNWNDLRYFLALARTGSVRGAGSALGVSHSTVARRIDALETELGVKLFDRHRDGFALTSAGLDILPAAEKLGQDADDIERGLLGRDAKLEGTVSLTCCDGYVSSMVLQGLVPFFDAHPDITLAITIDARPFDLSKREADLAIRVLGRGAEPPPFLIAQLLGPLVLANYVADAHASQLDPERSGAAPRWLGTDAERVQASLVAGGSYPDLPVWGSFTSLELIVQAAVAGLGIVMLPTYVGDRVPELRRLAQADLRHVGDLWLLCHPDLRANARVRAARGAIREVFRGHAGLFRGGLG